MVHLTTFSRRRFVQGTAALMASAPLYSGAAASDDASLNGRLYKTLKIGMVKVQGTLTDRFKAAKAAGFQGIEMDSPGMDVQQTRRAIQASGLPVDGTVCSTHWATRHSSPSAQVRATALDHLRQALRDTHEVGGNTALLVVGHGQDGPEDEIWPRTIENISQAIPLAAELGVYIAIENVWNHFLYEHDGPQDQSAAKFVKYVDELNSPWVGMQFDIGNHWKYGQPGDWIRALGRRIVKLDVKGFSRKADGFTNIGEGDLPWKDVRQALLDIDYYGWVAAEVSGGDLQRLQQISQNMDRVFRLTS